MRKIILHPRSIRSKHFLPWFRIRYYFFIIIIFFSKQLGNVAVTSPLRDITRKIEGTMIILRGLRTFTNQLYYSL